VPVSHLRPDAATTHASCAACGYLASVVQPSGLDQGGMALAPGGAYLVYDGGRGYGELGVVDVRDPRAMRFAAPTVPIGPHGVGLAGIMGVRIDGDHAYVAAGSQGVQIHRFPGLSGTAAAGAPVILDFALNGGASSTTSAVVTLNTTAVGAPVEYRAAESSDLASAPWLPYSPAPSFSLGDGNGSRQVWVQVRNAAGVESAAKSDTIALEAPVPVVTAFAINGGVTTTTSRTVTLDHAVSHGPVEYRASESSTFADAAWTPYAAAPAFELSAGNVTKRVYFQTRNAAGASAVRSDTIALREPLPVLTSVAINGGASRTTSRAVTLPHVANGVPAAEYRASESSTFAGAAWLPYTPAPAFQLSAGTATKRVYLQLRSATGAPSVVRSDTIILQE
jgi:hypothetical protein